MPGITTLKFTTNTTWVCPPDVTNVALWGFGGGGGATDGDGGASGGGGAWVQSQIIAVIPGTTYLITIGYGGSGVITGPANPGGPTQFSVSGSNLVIANFPGAGAGPDSTTFGGLGFPLNATVGYTYYTFGGGQGGPADSSTPGNGYSNDYGSFSGGGSVASGGLGAGGGGAGPNGAGATAHYGGTAGSAAANSGAGGAGGVPSGHIGGSGGSGYLIMTYAG